MMRVGAVIAIGHLGTRHFLRGKHPRQELLDECDRKHAERIFVNRRDGTIEHVGYVVGGEWFSLYRLADWKKQRND